MKNVFLLMVVFLYYESGKSVRVDGATCVQLSTGYKYAYCYERTNWLGMHVGLVAQIRSNGNDPIIGWSKEYSSQVRELLP